MKYYIGAMPPIATMASHGQQDAASRSTDARSNKKNVLRETGPAMGPCCPLLVVMVGLPISGKSSAARRIARRLNWMGHKSSVIPADDDPAAEMSAAHEALSRLREEQSVVILDGCNAKTATRRFLAESCSRTGAKIIFIEMQCTNPSMLDALAFRNDKRSVEEGLNELRLKLEECRAQYEPIAEGEGYIIRVVLTDDGPSVCAKNVSGYREKEILSVLTFNARRQRVFYLSRHGESEYNLLGRIGGDADLSPRGRIYADRLVQFTEGLVGGLQAVWTSQMYRTKRTVQDVWVRPQALRELNEIDAGICEGMTYEEIHDKYPEEFARRDQDKLNYRYPRGESYTDIISRVIPILDALESTSDILIVSHQAVIRVILGYFLDIERAKIPYQSVPLHTVIKITSKGYMYDIEYLRLNVKCVDTNRKQPEDCSENRSSDDALNTVPSHYENLQIWNGNVQTA